MDLCPYYPNFNNILKATLQTTGEKQLPEQSHLQLQAEENWWGTSRAMKPWPSSAPHQAASSTLTSARKGDLGPALKYSRLGFHQSQDQSFLLQKWGTKPGSRSDAPFSCSLLPETSPHRYQAQDLLFSSLRQVQGNSSGLWGIWNTVLKRWLCLGHR